MCLLFKRGSDISDNNKTTLFLPPPHQSPALLLWALCGRLPMLLASAVSSSTEGESGLDVQTCAQLRAGGTGGTDDQTASRCLHVSCGPASAQRSWRHNNTHRQYQWKEVMMITNARAIKM